MPNPFRTKAPAVRPDERTHVDDRRTGNSLLDGYSVLDQSAKPDGDDGYGSLSLYGQGNRNRRGLSEPVYDGPNLAYDEEY